MPEGTLYDCPITLNYSSKQKGRPSSGQPLGLAITIYAPDTTVRAWQGIASGILIDTEMEKVFIRLSLLCTAPSCKLSSAGFSLRLVPKRIGRLHGIPLLMAI
jgi:hypothetical protein